MTDEALDIESFKLQKMKQWRTDWCLFAKEVLGARLDPEQEAILCSVQNNPKTTVKSGTSRGKDYITAVACVCFFYLTPVWDMKTGEMIGNTKVAMTAPTDRQVGNIMYPEVSRLFKKARSKGFDLPGRLTGYDIRTDYEEWFLTGFKADNKATEAWTGFHAVNTMFAVTEASGMPEDVFNAIEGNLQGHSRLLIVFNDNSGTGYAAASQKKPGWAKFRLDSLNAPNVVNGSLLRQKLITPEQYKALEIPGQVDWNWVNDRVRDWCTVISLDDRLEEEGDFLWTNENGIFCYRPNDLFRVKVRGMAPKVSSGVLIPPEWIEAANARWKEQKQQGWKITKPLRLGVDVAGMGRDSSCFCFRFGHYVDRFEMIHSGGTANHMEVAGKIKQLLASNTDKFAGFHPSAFLDTIGEGAGVFSRLQELEVPDVYSVKFSESASWQGNDLKDVTGQYSFLNMRAYLYWALRDWLNPLYKTGAALPPDDELLQELSETQWKFRSDGRIQIEAKEDIKKRIGRSPDKSDGLANTFYPVPDFDPTPKKKQDLTKLFF